MTSRLSEIQIIPIKPVNGLVAFASFVLDGTLYLGSIGILTRPNGGYRLVYPTKKVAEKNLNIFYPINREFAQLVEDEIVRQFEDVMKNMIDTMVLTLNHGMFTILDRNKFTPSASGLYDLTGGYGLGGRANMKCTQNSTTNELKQGIYKPRLTVTKRQNKLGGYDIPLKIEFSAPKMLFGNNFDEMTDSDFPKLLRKLNTTLREQMDVYISEDTLANAPISSIHFSKNIALTDYTLPYTYIKQLTKVNINKKLDTNQTDYRNEGHSFKYRASSFEIAFYDKLKDLQQGIISEKGRLKMITLYS